MVSVRASNLEASNFRPAVTGSRLDLARGGTVTLPTWSPALRQCESPPNHIRGCGVDINAGSRIRHRNCQRRFSRQLPEPGCLTFPSRADASQVDGVSRRALRVVYDKVAIDVRWRAGDGVGIGSRRYCRIADIGDVERKLAGAET